MRIQSNIMAMNTHRQYKANTGKVSSSTEKLSSGYRVNCAADDAAGLAISEKMRAQIRGLKMASKNTQDAISLVQTAEGALQSTHNVLQRMRELAVQAASDTNETGIDRAALEQEFQQLKSEIDDTAAKTRFNDQTLIDGTFSRGSITYPSGKTVPIAAPFAASGVQPFGGMGLFGGIEIIPENIIDFDNLQGGESGDGWSYDDGVLTISGDQNFQINGSGAVTAKRIVVNASIKVSIVLNNVNIVTSDTAGIDIGMGATVNLTLMGTNRAESKAESFAGIQVSDTGKLTIAGDGELTAIGGETGAGIGGGSGGNGGTIIINSGTINAASQNGGAGIGGGSNAGYGTIAIHGGTVHATSERRGSGIGGGANYEYGYIHTSGSITITGGSVTAYSKSLVTNSYYGAGIGNSNGNLGGVIRIEGGTINAGSDGGAGIGGGDSGAPDAIIITGGDIIATGGIEGAGIGTGYATEYTTDILIEGGHVKAIGGGNYGAGIGGGKRSDGGTITITGGIVEATGSQNGAAIGGGGDHTHPGNHNGGDGADVTITGGVVIVDGRIGAGQNRDDNSKKGAAGTTSITGGSLSIADPATDVQGGITGAGGAPAYRAELTGVVIDALTEVPLKMDGKADTTAGTDAAGKMYLYLTAADEGKEVSITTADGKVYSGTVSFTASNDMQIALNDVTPPSLTPGTAERTAADSGRVKFTSDMDGEYYVMVTEAGAGEPGFDTSQPGISCSAGQEVSFDISNLTSSAKDVYIVVKGDNGIVSEALKIGLENFIITYQVDVTLPGGVTLPGNTNIDVTVDGVTDTYTTGANGELELELQDGDHTIELSHDGVNYEGTATVNGAGALVELAEVKEPEVIITPGKGLVIQAGANQGDEITIHIEAMNATILGIKDSSIASRQAASAAITETNTAINRVSSQRAALGAVQNRLEHKMRNLDISAENLSAAESRIRDLDMAKEMTAFTKRNIVMQAATAMLAQANANPQSVLTLMQ